MGKLVILNLVAGSLQQGLTVTLQISDDSQLPSTYITANLPPAPELNESYKQWQDLFKDQIGTRITKEREDQAQIKNASFLDKLSNNLHNSLNKWLDAESFRKIRDKLNRELNTHEEVRIIIQSSDIELRRLPWYSWDILKECKKAEVGLSTDKFERITVNKTARNKVKILAILGDTTGIDTEVDQKIIENLPDAETQFLTQPKRLEINDQLWSQSWDILFFAGHSQTEGETGRIYINETDSLTIEELINGLEKAIANGLQLAIFNSCDGLGLANKLADLNLPYIIVMREPVPDKVAQEFVKYFLSGFASGKSLYLAVKEARKRLQGIEDKFPCASWLPVICQNPAQKLINWSSLLISEKGSNFKRKVGLSLGTIVIFTFIILFIYPPSDEIILRVIIFITSIMAGFSAIFLLDSINLDTEISLSKWQIRITGGLSTFLIVLLLSWFKIQSGDNEIIRNGSITYRNLTAINDWPTLTLSFLKPTLNDTLVSNVLSQALNIETPPLVYSDNPVFESIENFKIETGNEQTIAKQNKSALIAYRRNTNNHSYTGVLSQDNQSYSTLRQNAISETQEEFRKNLDVRGEYDEFIFAPVVMPLKLSSENAEYTSILDNQSIIHFPKMSELQLFFKEDEWSLKQNQHIRNTWIKKIINNNPEIRGFLAFNYPYKINLTEPIGGCGNLDLSSKVIGRYTPTPYVRFIDIKNVTSEPIRIQSITYNILTKKEYELTIADNREQLLLNTPEEDKPLDIFLQPNQHIFIPTEFGFDTQSIKKELRTVSDIEKEKLYDISKKLLYVAEPISQSSIKRLEQSSFIQNTTEINKFLFMNKIQLSSDILSRISSLENLLNSIPKRFAVGSIINVQYLTINGKSIKVNPPKNEAPVSILAIFQEGSCPFLKVYNSETHNWLELGTVLYGRRDKSLQHDETYRLGSNISKVKIEEREPEVTYIDQLSFVYVDPQTKMLQEVTPEIPEIQQIDGQYLILNQGESLEIDLKKLIPVNSQDIKLKINGYYEILLREDLLLTPKIM